MATAESCGAGRAEGVSDGGSCGVRRVRLRVGRAEAGERWPVVRAGAGGSVYALTGRDQDGAVPVARHSAR
ncbi:hypothetical protein GCM10010234_20150 [Streptomyces hawaiiensis]